MMMRSVLCFLTFLLSVSCVYVSAEEARGSHMSPTEAEDPEGACKDSQKNDGSCASRVSAAPSTGMSPATPPKAPQQLGLGASSGPVGAAPTGPGTAITTTRGDTAALPDGQTSNRGLKNADDREAGPRENNPQPGLSSSLSPDQQPHDGSTMSGSEGQMRTNVGTSQDSQEENRNTEMDTGSTGSQRTDDSTQNPTADAPPAEITPSDSPSGDSNTLNNTGTESNSTTDTVTTLEGSEETNDDTTNAVSESTTTTTTTTLPPELTNNKKGDADSSSSISSSVWVRVPLLIVVTLACILVC
ncbi:uncharacterized protein TM35_000031700 [Trypanosoma theileri]|uniref:Mucin TcMUCII n=1 Tax=Trypanosoma theileri TaxID=67003 RepID=A0A1X0P660_9TRYP|nr:uncharacterized protein TM35_000031700 [Trypanosoma theileri]ORC92417.1 hypothetical protein TM35_000031700 [Trypanosoma theileri]